jgi:predicted thioesterase
MEVEVSGFNDEHEEDSVADDENEFDQQAVVVIVRVRPLLPDETTCADGRPVQVAVSVPFVDGNKLRVVAREGTPSESIMECSYDKVGIFRGHQCLVGTVSATPEKDF